MDSVDCKIGLLDELHFKIDMHFLHDSSWENLKIQAARLASLAGDFRDVGEITTAIKHMNRASHVSSNEEYNDLLSKWAGESQINNSSCPYGCGQVVQGHEEAVCERCQRMLEWCPQCGTANRLYEKLCQWCGELLPEHLPGPSLIDRVTFQWYQQVELPYQYTESIVAGDLLLVSDGENGEISALRLVDGKALWTLPDELPIEERRGLTSCFPFVYICTSYGIARLMPGLLRPKIDLLFLGTQHENADSSIRPVVDYTKHLIVFSGRNSILSHDYWRGNVVQRKLKGAEECFVYPVILDGIIHGITKSGSVWEFSSEFMSVCVLDSVCQEAGIPVVDASGKWVMFDGTVSGRRILFAWSRGVKSIIKRDIPTTLFDESDSRSGVRPLAFGRNVILVSSRGPMLILARVQAGELVLREYPVSVSLQNRRVVSIDSKLTSITGNYLVSRIAQGFFYMDLDSIQHSGIEFFESEMVSRPTFFRNSGLFLCSDGIRCYRLKD